MSKRPARGRCHRRGSGPSRSFVVWGGGVWGAAIVLLLLLGVPVPSGAQLEVLLRGLSPAPPHVGACGRYRFAAAEPSGPRELVFDACVERIDPGPQGSVWLRLVSGDSLEARVELDPALFGGDGGSLLRSVRSVFEVEHGDTTRIASEDWKQFPGLEPAPPLPGARDSLLGTREIEVGGRMLTSRGRRLHERLERTRPLGDVQMTQLIERDVETWTAPEAPILGIVRAQATIRSDRRLSAPVPGVPVAGARVQEYEIELLQLESGSDRPPGASDRRR
jgi:hypothetical protein